MDTKTITPETARSKRGLALYRSDAVRRHGDAYVVRGTARAYTVFLTDGEPRCDCPDYKERCRDAGHACKHGYAVVALVAVEACRRHTTARPKTTRH